MPIHNPFLLIGLTLLGSIAPLLTFANLWQLKEWRTDRLREHLRAEGYIRQFIGIVRPSVAILCFLIEVSGVRTTVDLHISLLIFFATISVIQIALRRQPTPVWTQKAITLTGSTFALTGFIAVLSYLPPHNIHPIVPPITVLIQPLLFAGAWLMFWPVDYALKKRVMQKAMQLRDQHPNLTVIGITGSVGKTTTKELLAHVLADANPLVTPAHVNTEMGVSNWMIAKLPSLAKRDDDQKQIAIVEMGAYRKGEIAKLCNITKHSMGVITFIGTQHIGLFGSQEALQNAKAEIITGLPEDGHAFLNADSELCRGVQDRTKAKVTTVGTGGHADIEAYDIEETATGIAFRLGENRFSLPLPGTHNVTNVLLTIAVARQLGMKDEMIAQRLQSFTPPQKTFTIVQQENVTILDDTHNASQESFKAAITWAKSQPATQKVLLTSGLIELGAQQDRVHTELGTLAASVFDRVVFLSKKKAESFERGYGKPVEVYNKKTERAAPDTLLVCEGRMNQSTIDRLLPQS